MGFIRFVPKNEKYIFDGNMNDHNDYEYKEFIFNSSELINVRHSYESNFILEDHPRNDKRYISFAMKSHGSDINCHHFLVDIDNVSINHNQYEFFIKDLFNNINCESPVTIEYDFYSFCSGS